MNATETDSSSVRWEGVINELAAKANRYETEITGLTKNRDALALDAELGRDGAARQLQKLQADISSKQSAASTIGTAMQQAQARLANAHKAEAAEAAEAERVRQTHITAAMQEYVVAIQKIDEALRQLAGYFHDAKRSLDTAESYMTADERAPVQQMATRSLFGPTLAVARFGLGDYIQLGSQAQYREHRKRLAEYSQGFVDRWVKPEMNEVANGNQH